MENKILKNIKNENGQAALLMVLVIMTLLLFIGLFLTDIVSKQIRTTENVEHFTQAYFLADTGTERTLYEFKNGTKDPGDFSVGDDLFSGDVNVGSLGHYNVILGDDSPLRIKVTGTHKNTARAIEISW